MRTILATIFVVLLAVVPAAAKAPPADAAQTIRAVLETPDAALDLAKAKLTFDKIVDSSIDVAATLKQLDQMTATVRSMAGPNASPIQKLAAVRKFIYVDGDWNGHRPFQYDLSDPLGHKIANKLLPTYLATRRGNCVSMPVLFIILADRLGLPVTASTAPQHIFAKFTDADTGKIMNIEATSGGLPARDAWYRDKMPMSDEAVKNGVYLKTLSRKETVAVMAEIVIEQFMVAKRYHDVIAVSDLITKQNPSFVYAILDRGSAYAGLIETEFKAKYPTPRDIPAALLPTYRYYEEQNRLAFEKAEALGWRDTDGEAAPPKP
jgi:regulator of sirC expression with transglutaminase-like and TPR domain